VARSSVTLRAATLAMTTLQRAAATMSEQERADIARVVGALAKRVEQTRYRKRASALRRKLRRENDERKWRQGSLFA
jgi:hypothetical protein